MYEFNRERMERENKVQKVAALTLMLIVTFVLVLLMCSCRSTSHVMKKHESVNADTLVSKHISTDMYERVRHMADSLTRVVQQRDSVITSYREMVNTHTGSSVREWEHVKDTMYFRTDSAGNVSYYFLTRVDREKQVHDTVFVDKLVEWDSKIVSSLRDSIRDRSILLDSINAKYASLDSVYRSLRDSVGIDVKEQVVKEKSLLDKMRDGLSYGMSFVCVILIVVCMFSKKKD